MPAAPHQCGSAMKESHCPQPEAKAHCTEGFHCPLPQGNEAEYNGSPIAHCPKVLREWTKGVPLPIAPRQ